MYDTEIIVSTCQIMDV